MTDKEIDRIIKANIKMAGFISLVKRMRDAQKVEETLSLNENKEIISIILREARKREAEVDEYLEKI